MPSNTRKATPERKTLLYSIVELLGGDRDMLGSANAIYSRLITLSKNKTKKR